MIRLGHSAFVLPVVLLSLASSAQSAVVPGFELIPLTEDSWYNDTGRVNNCGEVVFSIRHNNVYNLEEMYLYDNGLITRLTNDNVNDSLPDINDGGTMVWTRAVGLGGTAEIAIHDGTTLQLLSSDNLADSAPFINKLGHVTWSKFTGSGCSDAIVMFYDGITTVEITNGGYSDQASGLNDLDEIVWTRYDFCQSPWVSDIQLYSGGEITTLTSNEREPQIPTITFNDLTGLTQVGWRSEHPDTSYFGRLWDPNTGAVTIRDPGSSPFINSYGEIAMGAPGQGVHSSAQVWLYRPAAGQWMQATDEVESSIPRDINDYGEIVVRHTLLPETDLSFLRRIRNGDVDLDFDVDLDDYFEWSDCWTGPLETDGLCHCRFMDMQHDRDIDMADFAAFQNAFGQPVKRIAACLTYGDTLDVTTTSARLGLDRGRLWIEVDAGKSASFAGTCS